MAQTPTQNFLQIDQIREGVLLLKNKSLRGIIMVSSLNFALKSSEEQESTIYQFQNFLNSLDFSLEINIQSRTLNITGYIDKLSDIANKQTNELLKLQTIEYQKFIKQLIAGGKILAKNFFVIVPYTTVVIPGKKSPEIEENQFQRAKSQLWQRMEFVVSGLKRCGLQCTALNTSELIELFWSLYHPEEAEVGYYPEIPPEIIK